ncbi:NAD(P)H-dependent oxidoreductase [Chitinophaga pendula]|uniref:NAD(P)H-dependent oxidoreductase n=1 Tax=Chitinophaga TaxID=79328 RepID=UPI000BAF23E3|nr:MULTISPECIES: NAD(P)H-dependent oxidoreductase [Chitinophaga]ASZ11008.1 NADPH:quinone reductase [Chitinophaga sp. MD30]UCJ06002.1 NAD(P)H-dependent oxidoreductase [Chitinophaga pendula]
MKKILIINGHPDKESFNAALAAAYLQGASGAGAEVQQLILADLQFNPNLQYGYRKRTELEPDLLRAQELIKWANHLVWIHPVWWGSLPALLKGFLDRTFLPGYAFKYRENTVWWDKLLTGRSARIIYTIDSPDWFYKLYYRKPALHQLKKMTLEFCGITPVRTLGLGPIRGSKENKRQQWLQQVRKLGTTDAASK